MYFNQHLSYMVLVVLVLLVNQCCEGASTSQPATSGPEEENISDVEIAAICLGVGLTVLIVLLLTLLIYRGNKKLKKAARRAMEMRGRQQSGHENLATAIEEIDEKDTTDQLNTYM